TSAVGALAYTVGRHIAFAASRFAPLSDGGRHLIAHELTHVSSNLGGPRYRCNVGHMRTAAEAFLLILEPPMIPQRTWCKQL
ncbi:MAG: DUF4157 domain-containing protein, partial [Methylocapsa sp.]|nr:DUF4157 domain-containing protein [Methylocapsa sp.]